MKFFNSEKDHFFKKKAIMYKIYVHLKNGVIVIEMFCLALMHHYAFPVTPFSEGVGNMGVGWSNNIPALLDHSDVRTDVAEHVRVIGNAVQGGASRARTRIGDILCSQAWPPNSNSSGEFLFVNSNTINT